MDWSLGVLIDGILLKVETSAPRRALFFGEGAERIASYVAGWIAHRGLPVIVLDGANQFNPYAISALARRMLIPAERILKRILIARAFTCYQMTTLVIERLAFSHLHSETQESSYHLKSNIIITGPMNTFLDEDIRDRDSRILFDRFLHRMEEMSLKAFRFFLFQSDSSRSGFPVTGKREEGLSTQRRLYFTRRLIRFSDSLWRIRVDDEQVKIVLLKDGIKNNLVKTGIQESKLKIKKEEKSLAYSCY